MALGDDRRTVTIKNNHRDHRKLMRRRTQVKVSIVLIIVALLLVACIYFRVDRTVMDLIDQKQVTGIFEGFSAQKDVAPVEEEIPEVQSQEIAEEQKPEPVVEEVKKDTSVIVTGDVEISTYVQRNYDASGADGVVSPELRKKLKAADVLEINNEFAFSTRGTQAPDKQFTFRVDPKYSALLKEMGVDVAGLANNHVLDYGKEALSDTFTTLNDVGIPYTGAGESMDDASKLVVVEANDLKIGFLAASRVIPVASWDVANSQPGVFTCYDTSKLVAAISEAKDEVDYLIVCVHWGKEHTDVLTDYQPGNGHAYIDAGADAVIGAHPHVLQGIEFYNGKPIFYSLGNFIFNENIERTAAVKLVLDPDGNLKKIKLIPAYATGATTKLAEGQKAADIFSYLDSISSTATVTSDGTVKEK